MRRGAALKKIFALSQRLELVAKLETVLNMHVSGVCMSVVADPLAYLSDVAM